MVHLPRRDESRQHIALPVCMGQARSPRVSHPSHRQSTPSGHGDALQIHDRDLGGPESLVKYLVRSLNSYFFAQKELCESFTYNHDLFVLVILLFSQRRCRVDASIQTRSPSPAYSCEHGDIFLGADPAKMRIRHHRDLFGSGSCRYAAPDSRPC